jgi:transketolase
MTAPALHSNTTQPTQLMANAIRVLAMDAVQQANSGHPGAPMGMADIAVALWSRHLRHNPLNPRWPDRDRFVLSNGHGSMLIYALLHLTGYDLPMSELKNFRQLHSKTAGHPEYGITPGVETTTGPLGQGITNAVGMALAERLLGQEFNRPGFDIVNHHTYVFLGDGCLMEGISHEACSLAGTLGLNKLIALWDDNGISIDGEVVHWFNDDTPKRFEAYGWNVIRAVDGHNVDAVDAAIAEAKKSNKPTLICCRTVIGKGAPNKEGGHDVHGAPLGGVEIAAAREALAWPHAPFEVPQAVYDAWDAKGQGQAVEKAWNALFDAYSERHPAEAEQFERRMRGELPASFEKAVEEFIEKCELKAETIATRKASQNTLEAYGPVLGELLGGSADLTGSNLTNWIALHGGYIPYGGTFLTFSDYSRNALRMAALMKIRSIFVFTHDSIGLGEDGPTHQSIEHVASLRLIPNMDVWRTADTTETALALAAAIERQNGPSCLIFSRQNLPFQARNPATREAIARGGYVLRDAANGKPDVVIIATGSEVGLAVGAADQLAAEGIHARVVSVPATTVFDKQDSAYKASVLPHGVPRIAVEAGVTDFWWKYQVQAVVGIDTFGESAPAGVLFKHFGFTVENVVNTAKSVIA